MNIGTRFTYEGHEMRVVSVYKVTPFQKEQNPSGIAYRIQVSRNGSSWHMPMPKELLERVLNATPEE